MDGVVQVVRPARGVSYFVHDDEAVVVDPFQYIDEYPSAADERDLKIVGVADTHAHADEEYYLFHFRLYQPSLWNLELPDDDKFELAVVDPWEMTTDPLEGTYSGRAAVELPDEDHLAVRARRVG